MCFHSKLSAISYCVKVVMQTNEHGILHNSKAEARQRFMHNSFPVWVRFQPKLVESIGVTLKSFDTFNKFNLTL